MEPTEHTPEQPRPEPPEPQASPRPAALRSASARYGRRSSQITDHLRQMLIEMAGRLEANRPAETLTAVGRIAALQVTTMDPSLSYRLRQLAPEIAGPVTRYDYAALLRKAAEGLR